MIYAKGRASEERKPGHETGMLIGAVFWWPAIRNRLLFSSQLLDQPVGVIDRPQCLQDAA